MGRIRTKAALAAGLALAALLPAPVSAADYADAFHSGDTAAAAALAQSRLAEDAGDGQARFALGAAQFLDAVGHLAQGLHGFGLRSEYDMGAATAGLAMLPFLRLPVPPNPDPEPATYEGLRALLAGFADELDAAGATLSDVADTPFDLTLDLARLRIDMDGDGTASEAETILPFFTAVAGPAAEAGWTVDFDQSDAPWLAGYCHLLSAMAEAILAHDWSLAFEQTFHGVFPDAGLPGSAMRTPPEELEARLAALLNPDGTVPFYAPGKGDYREWLLSDEGRRYREYDTVRSSVQMGGLADLAAFVHLIRFPVVEPARMSAARADLLGMVAQSRENWRRVLEETDAGREWVPAPGRQEGIFPTLEVTDDVVEGWMLFLDSFEAVLEGELLLPHWRFPERGIDMRAMFEEPRTLDAVLIATGQGVLPYLREGPRAGFETVASMAELMGEGFFGYFVWFN